MRAKSLMSAVSLFVFSGLVQASGNLESLLQVRLRDDQLPGLESPSVEISRVHVRGKQFLYVTRDYGSGRELREVFLYRKSDAYWDLDLFSRTQCDKVKAVVHGRHIKLLCHGSVLFSVGVN